MTRDEYRRKKAAGELALDKHGNPVNDSTKMLRAPYVHYKTGRQIHEEKRELARLEEERSNFIEKQVAERSSYMSTERATETCNAG